MNRWNYTAYAAVIALAGSTDREWVRSAKADSSDTGFCLGEYRYSIRAACVSHCRHWEAWC